MKTFFSMLWAMGVLFLPPVSMADSYNVNFGTVAPDNTPWSDILKEIKTRVEKESGGRIQFKLFLGGVLGGEVEMVKDIRRGSRLQGGGFSTAAVATGANIPELQIMELPFLFDSFEECDYVMDTVLFDPMAKKLKEKGFILAFWAENGWRSFATKKKEIHRVEDLREHKMRSQEVDVHLAMYRALGVQASAIPVPEVMPALQTGMVDGFDNTPLFSQAAGWHEAIRFFSVYRHIYQPAAIIFNRRFFESLPEDLQRILLSGREEITRRGRERVRAIENDLMENFEDAGIKVYYPTEEERRKMADATRKVIDQFAPVVGRDLLARVLKAKEEFLKGSGKASR